MGIFFPPGGGADSGYGYSTRSAIHVSSGNSSGTMGRKWTTVDLNVGTDITLGQTSTGWEFLINTDALYGIFVCDAVGAGDVEIGICRNHTTVSAMPSSLVWYTEILDWTQTNPADGGNQGFKCVWFGPLTVGTKIRELAPSCDATSYLVSHFLIMRYA